MSHYSPIVAALVTILLTSVILRSKFGKEVQDIPNERSLHDTPIPRIGGVAMMAGIVSGWALMLTSWVWWLVLPLIGLFVVSLLDDMHSLSVKKRLSAHLATATILVVGSGLVVQQGVVVAIVVVLLTVWMTNLYNFMDGSDGLAGGMALFGFIMYGIAALTGGNNIFAMLNFSIGAAALGFLYYNFPPAKVFMGDAGSIPLGFLAAAMGLWGWQQGYWAVWFPLLVFSPFVVDASVTLVRRTLRRARITEAHREHYYQRAILMGFGHRNTALADYALMLLVGMSALWGLGLDVLGQAILLAWWCVIYSGLLMWIDQRWRQHQARQETTDVA